LDRLVVDLGELIVVESMPKQEGRNMIMVISPNKRYLEELAKQQAKEARLAAAAAAEPATDEAPAMPVEPEPEAVEPDAPDEVAADEPAMADADPASEGN
jgi:translation initiation factor IF-3